jgi:hypothetical protein
VFKPSTGSDYGSGPSNIGTTVQNLVISAVQVQDDGPLGDVDFVRFDPESDNPLLTNPHISYQFQDADFRLGDQYHWQVLFMETDFGSAYITPSAILNAVPTNPVVIPLDVIPPGVFGFDVKIEKKRMGQTIDSQAWRCPFIQIEGTELVQESNPETGDTESKVRFSLAPDPETNTLPVRALSEVKIITLNGDLTYGQNAEGPTSLNPAPQPQHTVNCPLLTSEAGGVGRVIVTGRDNEGYRYRDHQNHRLWPMIKKRVVYSLYEMNGPEPASTLVLPGGISYTGDYVHILDIDRQHANIVGPSVDLKNSLLYRKSWLNNIAIIKIEPLSEKPWPKEIWETLAARRDARGNGNTRWRPVLVSANAHGESGNFTVSEKATAGATASGGMAYPHTAWIDNNPPYPPSTEDTKKNYYFSAGPKLKGVNFFNMMGCKTAFNGNINNDHQPHSAGSDIASGITLRGGAANSMGYEKIIVPYYLGHRTGDWWAKSLFSQRSLDNGTALQSGYDAEEKFKDVFVGGFSFPWPGTTPLCGYDTWVVTNNNAILGY